MTKGIVIYYQEYKEYDALIHILCENKIVSCICKGVMKINSKNKSAVQLFAYSEFEFVENNHNMKILKYATLIDAFSEIRKDLLKQACALYACECMDKSNVVAFDLLLRTLKHLEHEVYTSISLFQVLLNQLVGVCAFVDGCVKCHSPSNIVAISSTEGGFVCANCNPTQSEKINFLKQFRIYSKATLNHYDLLVNNYPANKDLFLKFYEYFKEYSGIQVKSYRFLKQLF